MVIEHKWDSGDNNNNFYYVRKNKETKAVADGLHSMKLLRPSSTPDGCGCFIFLLSFSISTDSGVRGSSLNSEFKRRVVDQWILHASRPTVTRADQIHEWQSFRTGATLLHPWTFISPDSSRCNLLCPVAVVSSATCLMRYGQRRQNDKRIHICTYSHDETNRLVVQYSVLPINQQNEPMQVLARTSSMMSLL